ncbi:unnamed protein product [Penicillium nalgiovense]|nr:unnamed protein product [Penicillium nalgiovense]
MDGVSDAASLITLLQLASNVIKYVKDVKNAPAQRKRLLSALVQARGLLSTLIDLTNDVYDDNWSYTIQSLSTPNGPLSMFQEILEQIAGKIGVPSSGSTIALALHRLQWPFDQTGFQDVMASLEKLKSEQKLIVDSLSLMTLSVEMNGEKAMRMRTSTERFLRHVNFMQWHDVNTTPNTLVLTGSPGSGKSSICQVTRFFLKAWHQSEIEICVAYLALDSFQKEELTVSEALSNIVQQMMLERPYLMDHVNTLKFTGGQLSRAESIDVICRSRLDLKQFYLILDGLDECENMGRELFEDLLTIEPPLKILVATRPNRGIMMAFRNCVIINLNMPMSLSGHLEYMITLLEKDPRIFGYLDHNHDNVANAAKIITDKSNGMYQYTYQCNCELFSPGRN